MKKTQSQELKERELKQKQIEASLDRLGRHPDFLTYQSQILALSEVIKEKCIREGDMENVKGWQAQYALLLSIWKLGELPEERTEEGE